MLISSFLPFTSDRVLNKSTKGSGRQACFLRQVIMYNYNHKSNKKASKQTNKQFQHKVRIGSSLQQLVLLLPGLWEETVGSPLCSPWLTVSAQHRVINCYYYSTNLPSILCNTWYIINCQGMFVSSFLGLRIHRGENGGGTWASG